MVSTHIEEEPPIYRCLFNSLSRVFKGTRMGGRMGTDRVKVKGLKILKLIHEENIMVVKGCIPGHKGSYIIVEGK
ncbi:MAG: hypothetical protein R2772_00935 [Chitinophagales bacterium]